jgi:peroxiredoxin
MSRTASQMLPLGTLAPDFSLADPAGVMHSLGDSADARALLVAFICNHCPYVKHIRAELSALGVDCARRGVAMVAINSNDIENYPNDAPVHMATEIREHRYVFPYLFDGTQEVAKAYAAACTPDFYLFDKDRRLVYRGQLDDSRPRGDVPVTGKDLRDAIDAVLAGQPVSEAQTPSLGCNIKWKSGNEPGYFG